MTISRGRIAAFLVVVWIVGTALLMTVGPYADLDPFRTQASIPEETPGIDSADVANFLSILGPTGRALYARAQWFDFLTPLLFGAAAISALAWASARLRLTPVTRGVLLALPLLAVLAELIENSLLLSAVGRYPEPGMLANIVGPLAGAKLGLFAVTVASVLATSILVYVRARR